MIVKFEMDKLNELEGAMFKHFLRLSELAPLAPPFRRYFSGLVISKTQPAESAALLLSVNKEGMMKVAASIIAIQRWLSDPVAFNSLVGSDRPDHRIAVKAMVYWILDKFEDHLPGCTKEPLKLVESYGRRAEVTLN